MTSDELEQEHSLHERWIAEIEREWAPLFDACPDPVYIYIDDEHKTCSQHCAEFFGMTIQQFKDCESLLDECVREEDIGLVVHNYFTHFEGERRPISFDIVAVHQDGHEMPVTAYNIPIVHDGHIVLLCFLRPREL